MTARESKLTFERLRKVLYYDPDAGYFMWLVATSDRIKPGNIAGTMRPDGYVKVNIDGCPYMAHRLAWFYMTGKWPKVEIDHRYGIRDDNRFKELREADRPQNRSNQHRIRRDNTSGVRGVCWDKSRDQWIVMITTNGKQRNLGRFNSKKEAEATYIKAKKIYHPFSTCKPHSAS